MISQQMLTAMVQAIQQEPELAGCVIAFQGNLMSKVLDPGDPQSPNYTRVLVIIEEAETNDDQVLKNTQDFVNDMGGRSPEKAPNPIIVTNRSRMGRELKGMGLTCGLTVAAGVGVAGSAAGEVPSGGTSTFLLVASWVAFGTQSVECINSMTRFGQVLMDPKGNSLEQWDENGTYAKAMLIDDAINQAANLAALPFAVRDLWQTVSRLRGFAARGLTFDVLKSMNRMQRLKVISEIFWEASQTPGEQQAVIKAAREAQIGAKAMQRTSGLSVKQADIMVQVVKDVTISRLKLSLTGVVGTGVGLVASGMPESVVGSASGSINWIINVIGFPK